MFAKDTTFGMGFGRMKSGRLFAMSGLVLDKQRSDNVGEHSAINKSGGGVKMKYGNIQVEIESLWDSYTLSNSDVEKDCIMEEIERLYVILHSAKTVKELELV